MFNKFHSYFSAWLMFLPWPGNQHLNLFSPPVVFYFLFFFCVTCCFSLYGAVWNFILFYPHLPLLFPHLSAAVSWTLNWCFPSYCCSDSCSCLLGSSSPCILSLTVCFMLFLSLPSSFYYSTCFVVKFVVRSFYLLYFTFCVGQ